MAENDTADKAPYARRILVHYFRLAIESSGKEWDWDYEAEINGAIDDLIEASQ